MSRVEKGLKWPLVARARFLLDPGRQRVHTRGKGTASPRDIIYANETSAELQPPIWHRRLSLEVKQAKWAKGSLAPLLT